MVSSPSNAVPLFPEAGCLASAGRDLMRLRRLIAMARQEYLSASAAFDSCSVGLGQHDPELRSHAFLSQIDRLEAGIAILADAGQVLLAQA